MSTKETCKGACLCGAVRVSATIKSRDIGACHCAMCRQWGGGGPMFAVECEEDVAFEGEDHVALFSSSEWAERGFCRACGTHLFYRLKEGGHYALPVGLLGDDIQWRFTDQIFIDRKPAFYDFSQDTRNLTEQQVFELFAGD
ncbi:hypothetical protein J2T60_002637 [Natronospira proteinivora]|uniref:CENP-V/GFA domain-containing protein n=1 Tax=Natronospira proteinivora TaxID=1807133 RepID=A0ABT1GBE8_9GAMM|nr:GFA family protein [Natronospira proteinivora]MCP1728623.1 hypothetical protein [Natronospira proteinivora]